jgi:acyl carrier protein
MPVTRQEIEKHLHEILVDSFEIEHGELRGDANLFDDLGLDSLDAIDMLLAMETFVGTRLGDEDKENAKQIRTIDDVVVFVERLASRPATG